MQRKLVVIAVKRFFAGQSWCTRKHAYGKRLHARRRRCYGRVDGDCCKSVSFVYMVFSIFSLPLCAETEKKLGWNRGQACSVKKDFSRVETPQSRASSLTVAGRYISRSESRSKSFHSLNTVRFSKRWSNLNLNLWVQTRILIKKLAYPVSWNVQMETRRLRTDTVEWNML